MPDPNLDRLKAVSETAAKLQHQVQVCHNRHNQIGLGKYTLKYWPAIAADLIRLAECKEDVRAALEERDSVDDDHALLDRIQLIVSYKTPASAGGGKDE